MTHPTRSARRRLPGAVAALALAAGLALAGCTGEDAAATPTEPAEPTTTAPTDADAPVEVSLVDFAFEGLPASVPAGTRLTVTNEAEAELHELVAFRLPDDEDRPAAELAELPPDELLGTLGEPATVLLAPPGGDPIPAVGDGTLAEPGRYAVMCFIPTGADPQEYLAASAEAEQGPPDVDGGPPHLVHGMYAELVVE